jgi:outer membrane protein assembly factor BamA
MGWRGVVDTAAVRLAASVPARRALSWRAALLAVAVVVVVVGLVGAAGAEGLSDEDLAQKSERGYVTGLPLVSYSTDTGLGGGGRVYYYWNGTRDDPWFAQTPYLHRIFLQAFASTGGLQYHWLDYDAPRLLGSPYRIRSQLIFSRNVNSNYFGLGDVAVAPLSFPGSPERFDSYADYTDAQRRVVDGVAYTKYDQYDLLRPIFIASVERLLLDDKLRLLAGYGFTYADIRDYTGEQVDAVDGGRDVEAPGATTRLRADCDAGRLVGCDGGREGFLRLGISYDTRDYEPDPNRGVFADLVLDMATAAAGSEYDYLRLLGAVRGYWSPAPAKTDLVLAARALLELQTEGTPFFSMDSLPFSEDFRNGLGGHRTLRGYRQNRFVGRTMAAVTGEARWTFTRFSLGSQRFAMIAVPFVDAGRSFDHAGALTLEDWRLSYGGALRISWNLATILTIDYGRSAEDAGLYINFGHIF